MFKQRSLDPALQFKAFACGIVRRSAYGRLFRADVVADLHLPWQFEYIYDCSALWSTTLPRGYINPIEAEVLNDANLLWPDVSGTLDYPTQERRPSFHIGVFDVSENIELDRDFPDVQAEDPIDAM